MSLRHAILATISYSDYFSFPLKQEEIYPRLIKYQVLKSNFLKELHLLNKQIIIVKTDSYFHLPGHKGYVIKRKEKAILSRPLIHRARVLASEFCSLPGIIAIYLTGSLAVKNAGGDGDIDLMIICSSGTLWTTRFILTLITSILYLRRTPTSKNSRGKLCLNLYLTESSLTIPKSRQSLYTAYEIIQAVPLYDPGNTHSQLLAANKWLNDYLPNFSIPPVTTRVDPSYHKGSTLPIFRILESILYHLQLAYMKRRITREYITRDSAFFHPHNPGAAVLKKLAL